MWIIFPGLRLEWGDYGPIKHTNVWNCGCVSDSISGLCLYQNTFSRYVNWFPGLFSVVSVEFVFQWTFSFVVRNFCIQHEHKELWFLLIICLNIILSKDHYCVVLSWCDGAYGRAYYLLVFVKASVVWKLGCCFWRQPST